MKIYRGFEDKALKRKKRALAIGVFDGVHRGHQMILRRMIADAKKYRITSMAVTFDPNPAKVLFPKKTSSAVLMSLSHRLDFFKRMGINETLVIAFDRRLADIPREDFFENFLLKKLGMKSLTVGKNFRFGKKAAGDGAYLEKACAENKARLCLVPQLESGGQPISSTRIRQAIEAGKLAEAKKLLGRPVSVVGTVVHGRARGRHLGFPTANLDPHHEVLPPPAVYAAYGILGNRKLKGVLHIGERPTFKDLQKTLEVHFLHFHKNIYGQDIELDFVKKIRAIRRFSDAGQLQRAIQADIRQALQWL